MKILFLTLFNFVDINKRGITPDLMRAFIDQGHSVCVVAPNERKYSKVDTYTKKGTFSLLKVRCLNIVKTNLIEKGLATILIPFLYKHAINKYLKNEEFDIVLFQTPPVTLASTVKWLKKKYNVTTYLMLKDIFPQNSVDLGIMKSNTLLYKYFKAKEKNLYDISDVIGVMSEGNKKYLIDNYENVNQSKITICPNSISGHDYCPISLEEKQRIYEKYKIAKDKLTFVYGGNIGKPQDANFIFSAISEAAKNDKVQFVICGNGAKYQQLEAKLKCLGRTNIIFTGYLDKSEYDKLLQITDIGLVFLSSKFTIPNFPSRILPYMENSMPIIAATDNVSDVRQLIEKNNIGMWCLSDLAQNFVQIIEKYSIVDKKIIKKQGENANLYLKKHFTSEIVASNIIEHIKNK